MELEIKARPWKDAFLRFLQIPEFERPYPEEEYHRQLTGIKHMVLVAYINGKLAGFKIGYERDTDGSFYSWMGGVLPAFRGPGGGPNTRKPGPGKRVTGPFPIKAQQA